MSTGKYASIKFKYIGLSSSTNVFELYPEMSSDTVIDIGDSSHKIRNIYANNLYGTAMNAFSSVEEDDTSATLKFTKGDGTTTSNVAIDIIMSQVLKGQFAVSQIGEIRLCVFHLISSVSGSALNISAGSVYKYGDSTTIAAYGELEIARLSGSGTSFGNVSYSGSLDTGRWTLLSGAYFDTGSASGDWGIVLAIKTGLN